MNRIPSKVYMKHDPKSSIRPTIWFVFWCWIHKEILFVILQSILDSDEDNYSNSSIPHTHKNDYIFQSYHARHRKKKGKA